MGRFQNSCRGIELVTQIPLAFSTSLSFENCSLLSPLWLWKYLLGIGFLEGWFGSRRSMSGLVFFFLDKVVSNSCFNTHVKSN